MPTISYFSSAEHSGWPKTTLRWANTSDLRRILNDHELIQVDPSQWNDPDERTRKTYRDDVKRKAHAFAGCELVSGQRRKINNVIANSVAVLDVDAAGAYEKVDALVRALGVQYLEYTSFSSTIDHIKIRYIFPLRREIPAKDWARLWAGMNSYFQGLIDPKCKDPTRLYFLPIRPSVSPDVEHWIDSHDTGPLLDMYQFKDLTPITHVKEARPFNPMLDDGPLEGDMLREVTHDELLEYAGQLRRKQSDAVSAVGAAMKRGLEGKPIAEQGERNDTMWKVVAFLADRFYDCEPDSVVKHFMDSVTLVQAQGSKLTPELMKARFEEQSATVRNRMRQEAGEAKDQLANRIAMAIPGRKDPYSKAELADFMALGMSDKQWIIQSGTGSSYYFFVDGTYSRGVSDAAMLTHAELMLAPAITAGVNLYDQTSDGKLQLRAKQALMSDYGSVAEKVVVDLTALRSSYNPKLKVLTEATCPLRPLEAAYDEIIDLWLETLCGGKNDIYEKLCDWISVITFLQRPASALYMAAKANTGKSLLPKGLSRLWGTNGATKMKYGVSDFNDGIASNPLLHGDEALPAAMLRDGTGMLREFIQNDSWKLNRKFVSLSDVHGSLRLIITANNEQLLDRAGEGESLTAFDIEAIAQRFLFFTVADETADFLDEVGGRPYINPRWIEGDDIAKHALWLREQRGYDIIKSKERFIVCGGAESLISSLSVNTGLRGNVCHLLVSWLMKPVPTQGGAIKIKNGKLLVSAQATLDLWGHYMSEQRTPSLTRVAQALEGLSNGTAADGDYMFFSVNDIMLKAWAIKMRYVTAEAIDRQLKKLDK